MGKELLMANTTVSTHEITEAQSRQVAEDAREVGWRKPSFGKELFLGRLRLDLVHPHPRPQEADRRRGEVFLGRMARFLVEEVDPERIEADARIPDGVLQGLKSLGALGMHIDEEYGGLGLSQVYYNRALTLASSCHSALSTLLSAHQSIGVPQPLRLFGTEDQRRKYLPQVARDKVSAFLLTEPDVGSDPARMRSTATPIEGGSAYLINGEKLWTTNGVIADLLVVMAKVPGSGQGRGGITAFVVPSDAPGVSVLHRNGFMGLRGIENGVTRFEDVKVPAGDVVGEVGKGLKVALTTLNTGRLSLPAICAGSAKLSLKWAREWANERVQWGKPIGQHAAVAEHLSFMAGVTFAMEAVVELSGAMADEERNDIRIEAALAKLWCSEMAWQVADRMIQVRGGRGYETAASLRARGEKPVPAEQVLRDLRITRIFEGSSEIMRLFVAREAVDTHLSVAGSLVDPSLEAPAKVRAGLRAAGFYARWLPTLVAGPGMRRSGYSEFGSLAEHLRFVERGSRRLARSLFYGMARWQEGLERRQVFLGRLVDVGAELFAMSAACVRAAMLVEPGGGPGPGGGAGSILGAPSYDGANPGADGGAAVELADLFCRGSRRRVERLFAELWDNDDDDNYQMAQRVLEGRYAWAEQGVMDPAGPGPMLGNRG
jgi:alkylation response protein AidB-like acyl-CoA dehydrogenase